MDTGRFTNQDTDGGKMVMNTDVYAWSGAYTWSGAYAWSGANARSGDNLGPRDFK